MDFDFSIISAVSLACSFGAQVLYPHSVSDGWLLCAVHFAQGQDEGSAVTEKLRDA